MVYLRPRDDPPANRLLRTQNANRLALRPRIVGWSGRLTIPRGFGRPGLEDTFPAPGYRGAPEYRPTASLRRPELQGRETTAPPYRIRSVQPLPCRFSSVFRALLLLFRRFVSNDFFRYAIDLRRRIKDKYFASRRLCGEKYEAWIISCDFHCIAGGLDRQYRHVARIEPDGASAVVACGALSGGPPGGGNHNYIGTNFAKAYALNSCG